MIGGWSACGSVMDLLRSCYKSKQVLFSDRLDVQVDGQWFWAPAGAKPLPFATCFASSQWDPSTGEFSTTLGEIKQRGAWVNGTPAQGLDGQHFCGDRDAWQHGVPYAERGNLPVDADGVPLCCQRGQFMAANLELQAKATLAPDMLAAVELLASVYRVSSYSAQVELNSFAVPHATIFAQLELSAAVYVVGSAAAKIELLATAYKVLAITSRIELRAELTLGIPIEALVDLACYGFPPASEIAALEFEAVTFPPGDVAAQVELHAIARPYVSITANIELLSTADVIAVATVDVGCCHAVPRSLRIAVTGLSFYAFLNGNWTLTYNDSYGIWLLDFVEPVHMNPLRWAVYCSPVVSLSAKGIVAALVALEGPGDAGSGQWSVGPASCSPFEVLISRMRIQISYSPYNGRFERGTVLITSG